MKIKTLIVILVLLASAISFIPINSADETYEPQTDRHVGSGQTYSTIQSAIDAANDGDTIIIHDGTYNERLVIDGINHLTIQGYSGGREGVIIDDPHTGGFYDTIHVSNSNNLTLENFTVTDADSYCYGIWISEGSSSPPWCEYVTIRNINILDNDPSGSGGIYLDMLGEDGHGHVYIYDCWIENCNTGIGMQYCSNTWIYHNNITNCGTPLNWQYSGSNNWWNTTFPFGGNYIDDYDSAGEGAYDNDYDGMADDPFSFSSKNALYCWMTENGWEDGVREVGTGKEYTTIASAVSAANDENYIYIYDGSYSGSQGTDKILHYYGESRDGVILTGSDSGIGIDLQKNYSTIRYMTIKNFATCINIGANYTKIINNNLSDCSKCIECPSGRYNQIYMNNMVSTDGNAWDNSTGTNYWYNETLKVGNYWSDYDSAGEGAYDNNSDGFADENYSVPGTNGDSIDVYPLIDYFNGTIPTWEPLNVAPNQPTFVTPMDNGASITVYTIFSVRATDNDGNNMSVSFYWNNHTLIQTVSNVFNNTNASINLTSDWLDHNTTYYWYVNISDGTEVTHSPTYNFTTCRAWDTNADGEINYEDLSTIISNYNTISAQTQTIEPESTVASQLKGNSGIPDIYKDDSDSTWRYYEAQSAPNDHLDSFDFTNLTDCNNIEWVRIYHKVYGQTGGGYWRGYIYDGSNAYYSSNIACTQASWEWHYAEFTTNPSTSSAWTKDEINDYIFGIYGGGTANDILISELYVAVRCGVCQPGHYSWDIYEDGVCNYFDVSLVVTYYGDSY